MKPSRTSLLEQEPRLVLFTELARDRLGATEVWLFGSRARGDNDPDSDWDLMVVVPDDIPESLVHCVSMWRMGREVGLMADVLSSSASDLYGFGKVPTTLEYEIMRDGIKLFELSPC